MTSASPQSNAKQMTKTTQVSGSPHGGGGSAPAQSGATSRHSEQSQSSFFNIEGIVGVRIAFPPPSQRGVSPTYPVIQYKIRWQGYSEASDTWQSYTETFRGLTGGGQQVFTLFRETNQALLRILCFEVAVYRWGRREMGQCAGRTPLLVPISYPTSPLSSRIDALSRSLLPRESVVPHTPGQARTPRTPDFPAFGGRISCDTDDAIETPSFIDIPRLQVELPSISDPSEVDIDRRKFVEETQQQVSRSRAMAADLYQIILSGKTLTVEDLDRFGALKFMVAPLPQGPVEPQFLFSALCCLVNGDKLIFQRLWEILPSPRAKKPQQQSPT